MNRKYAKIKKSCLRCGKEFKIYPCEEKDNRRFCSKNCWYKYTKSIKQKKYFCDYCGKEFIAYKCMVGENRYRYCSSKCARKDAKHRSSILNRLNSYKISVAKQKFHITKQFLLNNYVDKKNATINSVANLIGCRGCTIRKWMKKYNIPPKNAFIYLPNSNINIVEYRNYGDKARKFYGSNCMICGYHKSVDAHKIIPQAKGGNSELDNLIILCPNHHREAHLSLIQSNELQKIIVNYKEKVRYSK